ncbi:PaaI family thioesterase [Mycolicibacterium peregrinum]|uniref:Phenylacetic acid degradation protein n=1 Tax=Mycolicibacterium peregrinum TaxID=43304 RepID=A0A1A0VIB3_MYCPR|nr:PaaI family thioesterase [Mycolicibacterium peregrinum]OBB82987.1 phenylacetic acid degradation protein [Mycolicibacterium peregrinum]
MTETVHVLELLEYREVESSADGLVLEMDNRPDLANVRGALQGGLVATLIDIAAGMLAGNASGVGYDVTTADLNIHFLAPIMGTARAEAKVVRAGKRLIVTSVDVTDVTRGRLAARATLTFAVLEPR